MLRRALLSLLATSVLTLSVFIPSSLSATPPIDSGIETRGIFDDLLTPRKKINTRITGVNAFANDRRFGSVRQQYAEVKNTLKLNYVRVLFSWNDSIQPTPSSTPNFSFYDDIASSIPSGVQALVILTSVPTWMRNSSNWIDGNPRKTFVELWVKKVVDRYAAKGRLTAYQIWNEGNMTSNPDNTAMGLSSPANYIELAQLAANAIDEIAPQKLVVSSSTTAINQNYPNSLNYNKTLRSLGLESIVDIWGIHFYGSHIENMIRPDGVESFLKQISIPIWVTESGQKGTIGQREYVERYWPYLKSKIPSIARFYYYQFTENTPAKSTYGLKNLTKGKTLSDLYIYLRDRSGARR